MKPFEDMLPEEKEPQHEELITILQRAYRKPVPLLPIKEAQVIERVRERLMQAELEDSTTEDIFVPQRGVLDSTPHKSVSPIRILRRDKRRLHLIALLAAALLVAVLLVAPLLLLRHASMGGTGRLPTLTLSSHAAWVGDSVTFTLKHVTPSTSVALTHDIQEPILINGSSFITTDKQGTAIFSVVIDKSWRPGSHQIVAEDVVTRNTAIADLQITGQDPTPPPHLLVDSISIHMGADVVGANTIRPFNLVNSGGGSITWSASSNQSWLFVSPNQGTYSQRQTISLAVQRAGLKPGNYTGSITISSNVSTPQHIEVDMIVRALLVGAGAVQTLPPALLSFTATDGGPDPSAQSLTMSNPGSRPLNWSLAINAPVISTTQAFSIQEQGPACRWLRATPHSGTVAPGASRVLTVSVQSQCLLPGIYRGTLQFMGAGANDVTQTVNVSLTVQPHCGLVTSTGYLSFTVVQGQSNRTNQAVSLNTANCVGVPLSWTSVSSASWLVIPASGQLKGTANTLVPVKVHANSLVPGMYAGNIIFATGQSTLTVMVQLTVQAAPPLVAPIMDASPLTLNFSTILGQTNPTGQVVTLTNNGSSALKWMASTMPLDSGWLGASPSSGTIAPGKTGQVTINVNSSQLTPGNYMGQVTLNGIDMNGHSAAGSPQTIIVNLVVQPSCSLSPPSSSVLSFSAVQGAPNPPSQTVTFMGIGGCAWPVTWTSSVTPTANWLTLTAPGGTVKGTGQSGSIGVGATIAGLKAGTYITQVTIAASDATGGTVQGSSQTFSVTLTVQPPCVLSPPSPVSLAFSVPQGQSPSTPQHVTVSQTGTCVRPVTWTATGDPGSSTWLVLVTTSGTDSGSGITLEVNVNAANVTTGAYTGTITIAATDSAGAVISPQSINVSLTVTGYTISGNVVACPGSTPPTCLASQALPGATVTLMSGNATVATTTADSSGNYAFSNIPLGAYIINVAGYDASNIHYVGSSPVTVTGNISINIQVFPG